MRKTKVINHQGGIKEIIVENDDNFLVKFLNLGARVIEILHKNKEDIKENVVLKYESIDTYKQDDIFLNSTIGPYAGRIKNAGFKINNQIIKVAANEGETCLHSNDSIQNKIWDYSIVETKECVEIIFKIKTVNNENGFPGNSSYTVRYSLKDQSNSLIIKNTAFSDQDTIFNLTNHIYFNLSGNCKNNILNHNLYVKKARLWELDSNMIPIKMKNKNNLFDLSKKISLNFLSSYELDDIFDFDGELILEDPKSRRRLTIKTNLPNVVLYAHNKKSKHKIISNQLKDTKLGLAIEVQYLSNEINLKDQSRCNSFFKRGEIYESFTKLHFSLF